MIVHVSVSVAVLQLEKHAVVSKHQWAEVCYKLRQFGEYPFQEECGDYPCTCKLLPIFAYQRECAICTGTKRYIVDCYVSLFQKVLTIRFKWTGSILSQPPRAAIVDQFLVEIVDLCLHVRGVCVLSHDSQCE